MLGAALLNANCELLRFGGEVMKNVAGYDISRVLAGSLGILGPIVEVSLKVLPLPPARTTLRFEWREPRALQQLQQWAALPLPLRASAWWNDTLVVQLAGASCGARGVHNLGGEHRAAAAEQFWVTARSARRVLHRVGGRWRAALRCGPRSRGCRHWPPIQAVINGRRVAPGVNQADAATMRRWPPHGGHATEFRGCKRDGVFTPLLRWRARIND